MKEEPVKDVLQVAKRLALTADKSSGIVALHFQQQSFLQVMLLDRGVEAEMLQELYEGFFRLFRHKSDAKRDPRHAE
jgi:hypothetical protein